MNEPDFKIMFREAFGRELTARELWTITLFAKRVRKYARNNSAFNNLANRAFPYAKFRQVQKERSCVPRFPGGPTTEFYEGLEISVRETVAGD